MEEFLFLLPPLTMCIVLIGIHCYLGLHVLKRGIIFIDLSLAQVAGLGSTFALLFHLEHHSTGNYLVSLGFTFLASLLFTWAKKHENKISQEVLIGLVYALSSALIVLIVNQMAHGAEHIKEILIGHIAWVSWSDVLKTFLIYSIVGTIHFVFRKQLLKTSFSKAGEQSAKWDFLFFALFGIVITSSVSFAGILLVFSLLIVPALISTFFVSSIKKQLILGWVIGFIVASIGMILSFKLDLPSGAVLVVCFSSLPIILLFLPKLSK